jgi:hypothetical protein
MKKSVKFTVSAVPLLPVMGLLYWVVGWQWPVIVIAAFVWLAATVCTLAWGAFFFLKKGTDQATMRIIKARVAPTWKKLLVSTVTMVFTAVTLYDALYLITLAAYAMVCAANLYTWAEAWRMKREA